MRGTWRRRLLGGLSVLALGSAAGLAGSAVAAAASGTGQVYVIHGIVGDAVDIAVDGRRLASGARTKTIVGPVRLPAGQHVVTLSNGGTTVATARFDVVAGRSIDVVAHRTADAAMAPRIVVFRNNLAAVGPGKTRLVVSHTAVAPPADIRIDGRPFFRNVASGESLSLVVPAKTYSVDVVPSTGRGSILGPVDLTLQAGTVTRVFAIGDPAKGTADAIVQVLKVRTSGSGQPSTVATGDGGQAADEILGQDGGLGLAVPVTAAGLLALLGAAGLAGGRLDRFGRLGRLRGIRHAR
jgi:hypothetical protein